MAHTNETVNYHLSQFVGTDIPNPLVDYNGDMEKIDTAIKNVADSAVSQTSRIVALETQNGDTPLATTAQTISGAINELDGEISGIDTRLTTAEGKIVEDETTLGTAVGNISTLSGKASGLETKVGSAVLTTVASDCSGAINELDGEVGTLANLTTTAKNNVVSAVNEVDADITALETQNGSEVLTTTAQTLSGAVNELDDEVGNLASLETTVKTDVVSAINEVNTAVENAGKWEQILDSTAGSTTATNVATRYPLNKYKEIILLFTNANNIISATTITTYDLFKLGGVEVDIYINDRNYVTVRYVDDTHVDVNANISQSGLVCMMRGIV